MEFKKALQYHQSGQLQRAREINRTILEINPDHCDSLHLLCVMDFLADDAQSYADIANRLANDKAFKNEIKNRILKNADILSQFQNVQFCSRSRKAEILTTGIHGVFRGLKFEPDADIGQKGTF